MPSIHSADSQTKFSVLNFLNHGPCNCSFSLRCLYPHATFHFQPCPSPNPTVVFFPRSLTKTSSLGFPPMWTVCTNIILICFVHFLLLAFPSAIHYLCLFQISGWELFSPSLSKQFYHQPVCHLCTFTAVTAGTHELKCLLYWPPFPLSPGCQPTKLAWSYPTPLPNWSRASSFPVTLPLSPKENWHDLTI